MDHGQFEFSGTSRVALAAALATFAASAFASGAPLEFYKVENAPPGMTLPFSEAVRAGDMLYLAGMVGTDASGKLVAGGIGPETKQIMENIGASLAKHGSSYDRVVQCTVALADIKEWPAFNEAYKPFFQGALSGPHGVRGKRARTRRTRRGAVQRGRREVMLSA